MALYALGTTINESEYSTIKPIISENHNNKIIQYVTVSGLTARIIDTLDKLVFYSNIRISTKNGVVKVYFKGEEQGKSQITLSDGTTINYTNGETTITFVDSLEVVINDNTDITIYDSSTIIELSGVVITVTDVNGDKEYHDFNSFKEKPTYIPTPINPSIFSTPPTNSFSYYGGTDVGEKFQSTDDDPLPFMKYAPHYEKWIETIDTVDYEHIIVYSYINKYGKVFWNPEFNFQNIANQDLVLGQLDKITKVKDGVIEGIYLFEYDNNVQSENFSNILEVTYIDINDIITKKWTYSYSNIGDKETITIEYYISNDSINFSASKNYIITNFIDVTNINLYTETDYYDEDYIIESFTETQNFNLSKSIIEYDYITTDSIEYIIDTKVYPTESIQYVDTTTKDYQPYISYFWNDDKNKMLSFNKDVGYTQLHTIFYYAESANRIESGTLSNQGTSVIEREVYKGVAKSTEYDIEIIFADTPEPVYVTAFTDYENYGLEYIGHNNYTKKIDIIYFRNKLDTVIRSITPLYDSNNKIGSIIINELDDDFQLVYSKTKFYIYDVNDLLYRVITKDENLVSVSDKYIERDTSNKIKKITDIIENNRISVSYNGNYVGEVQKNDITVVQNGSITNISDNTDPIHWYRVDYDENYIPLKLVYTDANDIKIFYKEGEYSTSENINTSLYDPVCIETIYYNDDNYVIYNYDKENKPLVNRFHILNIDLNTINFEGSQPWVRYIKVNEDGVTQLYLPVYNSYNFVDYIEVYEWISKAEYGNFIKKIDYNYIDNKLREIRVFEGLSSTLTDVYTLEDSIFKKTVGSDLFNYYLKYDKSSNFSEVVEYDTISTRNEDIQLVFSNGLLTSIVSPIDTYTITQGQSNADNPDDLYAVEDYTSFDYYDVQPTYPYIQYTQYDGLTHKYVIYYDESKGYVNRFHMGTNGPMIQDMLINKGVQSYIVKIEKKDNSNNLLLTYTPEYNRDFNCTKVTVTDINGIVSTLDYSYNLSGEIIDVIETY